MQFGFTGERLRLEYTRVPGVTLAKLLQDQAESETWGQVTTLLTRQLQLWRGEHFVHGDLSLTNTLVDLKPSQGPVRLWFIDWLVDLNSFEGTPQFTSAEVFRGHRSHASDRYAIDKILCIVRRHGEGILNDARD